MQGTSNQTSQDSLQQELPQRWTGGPGFRKKRDPAEAALAATPGVQRIVENQPTFRQYFEDLLWTATRSEVEGDIRYRSGNWQQDVVRSRSPIKWSTPQPWMDTAQGTTSPGRMMERKNTGYLAHHWRTNLKDVKLWTIWDMKAWSRRQENPTVPTQGHKPVIVTCEHWMKYRT